LHVFLIIYVHVQVFWYLPIKGNIDLYGTVYCDSNNHEVYNYGCFNFHSRLSIIGFYCLWLIYFSISANQLRYGLPIQKYASSVCSIESDEGAPICAVYMAIPFIAELRCLLDFIFSKTALDPFQYWQCFSYHTELYQAKWNNKYYVEDKRLGDDVTFLDARLPGYIICVILMALTIGPFILFSELGGFV